jgi:hypothetical protein
VRESPPDRFLSPDGKSGWYASPPEGYSPDDDEPWEGPRSGTQIRFMAEDTVDVPLWSEDGLIIVDGEELMREWGISEALAVDVVAWGRGSQAGDNPRLDAEAARLIRLLNNELEHRFHIVYEP